MRDRWTRLAIAMLCGLAPSLAVAGGREGEQYAPVVLAIVAFALIAFVASMAAGVAVGIKKAGRSGTSRVKGGAYGLLTGLLYFVVVGAFTTAVVSILGFLWIAFALVYTGLTDSP